MTKMLSMFLYSECKIKLNNGNLDMVDNVHTPNPSYVSHNSVLHIRKKTVKKRREQIKQPKKERAKYI